ncbi:MAG: metalloregulator ArsR/SmtB family transcription factor [Oligoflexia bacterium]|nr:metalloregulator ArsR/SmtB family transcription factor [Oligoflexia bacterium]
MTKSTIVSKVLAAHCEDIARILKSLAHPTRLKILCHLLGGERTVNEIIEFTGSSQSGVSQYLARMKLEGMVASRREGQFIRYRISDHRLERLMKLLKEIYCD